MTPSEERARIDEAVEDIESALSAAYADMLAAIIAGQEPRAAVAAAMGSFTGAAESAMRAAFAEILAGAVGSASDVPIVVGAVSLSASLYAEAQATSEVVRGIVQKQAAGVQDARALALQLFEGYGFRDPAAEPLKMAPNNPKLPLYMREALLADDSVLGDMSRGFAKLQAGNLSTPALRAAYSELLAVIDSLDGGPKGQALLKRKLDVAFFERMRYFATRIARTELHKAYAEREVLIMRADPDIEFVQVRRSPGQNLPCICDLFSGRDLYGLGPGVYPKEQAPVPGYHPFCRCVLAPRLDLTGRTAKERDEGGDAYFLSRLGEGTAGRIMGSRAKADEVLQGNRTAEEVANASRNPAYRVRRAEEITQPAP